MDSDGDGDGEDARATGARDGAEEQKLEAARPRAGYGAPAEEAAPLVPDDDSTDDMGLFVGSAVVKAPNHRPLLLAVVLSFVLNVV